MVWHGTGDKPEPVMVKFYEDIRHQSPSVNEIRGNQCGMNLFKKQNKKQLVK